LRFAKNIRPKARWIFQVHAKQKRRQEVGVNIPSMGDKFDTSEESIPEVRHENKSSKA
jgi:hypothetical protein